MDEKSSFDDICNGIEEKISKWQEYYALIENDTKQEITTKDVFDDSIKKGKESESRSVLFLCQPKYTFQVTDETDSKENEFSLPYFALSIDTFEKFVKKVTENCLQWDENCQIIHNAPNNSKNVIENDDSFHQMIENSKHKQKANIFVCLKMKVCDSVFVCCAVFVFW